MNYEEAKKQLDLHATTLALHANPHLRSDLNIKALVALCEALLLAAFPEDAPKPEPVVLKASEVSAEEKYTPGNLGPDELEQKAREEAEKEEQRKAYKEAEDALRNEAKGKREAREVEEEKPAEEEEKPKKRGSKK